MQGYCDYLSGVIHRFIRFVRVIRVIRVIRVTYATSKTSIGLLWHIHVHKLNNILCRVSWNEYHVNRVIKDTRVIRAIQAIRVVRVTFGVLIYLPLYDLIDI